MGSHELVRGVAVVMLAPALGQHVFLLGLEHREFADFGKVMRQAAFGDGGQIAGSSAGH